MPLNDYTYWIDANLPPKTVEWLETTFNVSAKHVFNLDLLSAEDNNIFQQAKDSGANIIILTKDEDFVDLVMRRKPPPKIIWITIGNITNIELKNILLNNFTQAVKLLHDTDNYFIEISK